MMVIKSGINNRILCQDKILCDGCLIVKSGSIQGVQLGSGVPCPKQGRQLQTRTARWPSVRPAGRPGCEPAPWLFPVGLYLHMGPLYITDNSIFGMETYYCDL